MDKNIKIEVLKIDPPGVLMKKWFEYVVEMKEYLENVGILLANTPGPRS